MSPDGKHDWALGAYFDLEREWKAQLKAIVGRHISLAVIVSGEEADVRVRRKGVLLWARERARLRGCWTPADRRARLTLYIPYFSGH